MSEHIKTQLIDARNFAEIIPNLIKVISEVDFMGLDIETHDDGRHNGLNIFCGYDPITRKKTSKTKPLAFDTRRTVVTGFSIYPEGHDTAYYVNLNHADVENRVPWEAAKFLLTAKKESAYFVAHNAPFELTMLGNSLGFEIDKIICTLQQAVSTYGPDDYSIPKFRRKGLDGMKPLMGDLMRASVDYNSYEEREMKGELAELANKITSKQASSAWSYIGWSAEVAWGYGLKRAVKSHFGVTMKSFDETLGDKAHMGQLTGEEVCAYGADDAYWAVRLFRHLMALMAQRAPGALSTFFTQENPMVHVFSDIWREGMVVDINAVHDYREKERKDFAELLRELKVALRETGGFADAPDPRLVKRESWYAKNHAKYRKSIWEFATSPDTDDDYEQCQQIRSPVSNAWADDEGLKQSTGVNIVHYMPQRVLMYDLLKLPLSVIKGKVQSDGECRGKLLDKARKADQEVDDENALTGWKETAGAAVKVLELLNKMSSLEQRMKLYLTPYTHLIDPETGRVYPSISSELATRRMAARNPNGMQLAKRGESVYVRGFYEGDNDEHVVFSRDWSAIELVIIGEASGDQEFAKAYSTIPHGDLHAGASADILGVNVIGLTEDQFKSLRRHDKASDFVDDTGLLFENCTRLFTDLKGNDLSPQKAYKYWRTEIGKGANFNFWYSGWLGTVGEKMGWSMEQTGEAVKRYTDRFWQAEGWRRGVISSGQMHGFVELPDGHRRYRYEATEQWREDFVAKFPLYPELSSSEGFNGVINEIARRIQKRSYNQLVNAYVQGTCATLAKRSILRIREECRKAGLTSKEVRFLMPIHDELLYSVHKDYVHVMLDITNRCMSEHPDLFPTLKIDSSPAIGLNFEPWTKDKSRLGQVELYEPPALIVGDKLADTRLDKDGVQNVIDWLFDERKAQRANRLIAA